MRKLRKLFLKFLWETPRSALLWSFKYLPKVFLVLSFATGGTYLSLMALPDAPLGLPDKEFFKENSYDGSISRDNTSPSTVTAANSFDYYQQSPNKEAIPTATDKQNDSNELVEKSDNASEVDVSPVSTSRWNIMDQLPAENPAKTLELSLIKTSQKIFGGEPRVMIWGLQKEKTSEGGQKTYIGWIDGTFPDYTISWLVEETDGKRAKLEAPLTSTLILKPGEGLKKGTMVTAVTIKGQSDD